jgi:hypothetical protein
MDHSTVSAATDEQSSATSTRSLGSDEGFLFIETKSEAIVSQEIVSHLDDWTQAAVVWALPNVGSRHLLKRTIDHCRKTRPRTLSEYWA